MAQRPPDDPAYTRESRLRRSLAFLRNGRPDLALPLLKRLDQRHPGTSLVRLSLGAALLRTGEAGQALAAFDSVLFTNPADAGALRGRGLCLNSLGEVDGALDAFRRAVASDPNAWRTWRSIADITPHEDERLHAIEGAADALRVACQPENTPVAALADFATALIEARASGRAVQFLATHPGAKTADPALLRARARSLYHAGDHSSAFLAATELLRSVERLPPANPVVRSFDQGKAIASLTEIRSLFTAAGIESFLVAGTLLGFRRNGGPLPHDRDIDIGVFRTSDGGPDIAGILRKAPGFLLPRIARPGDRYFGLIHKGVGVDIFVHDRSGDHLLCGFTHISGDIQWRFRNFGVTPARYAGQNWMIPENPDQYLSQTYGAGWRRPDKAFVSVVSSPALYGTSLHARAYYAVMRASAALAAGDTRKANALIASSPVALSP